ncbi:MAG: TIGR02266 family protein [Deltaproteobacteria bacterium]|nr:TIGR02266 family protein [Deltaproteobacteria bacterium]
MFVLVSEETYEDGKTIFKEGSSGDWVYMILSGSVQITKTIDGKKFVLEVLKKGEIFGELSFIGGIKRTATVKAVGETTVGIIDRNSLDVEFNKLSSDFRSILVAVVRRFKSMIDRASDFSARAELRVIKTLSLIYKDKQSFLKAYTGNISKGGLFINTKTPLAQGTQFLLNLQLPDIPEPMKIKCEVAWAKKQGDDTDTRPAGMGIKFIEMAKNDNKTLQNYIQPLMKG